MHLLQSPYWSAFKSQFGWSKQTLHLPDSRPPTQILFRRLPLGFKVAYVPKGPAIDWNNPLAVNQSLTALKRFAKQRGTLFLKIEADADDTPSLRSLFQKAGFVPGKSVQPKATIIIDIEPSEEAILAAMKSKTRYNIRLAARKGVTVRQGSVEDLTIFDQLNQLTARRDGFAVHPLAYYQAAFQQFPSQNRVLLLAEFQGTPLAGLIVFTWEGRAYYLYGASGNEHRNKMPTYLLQWEAIKWAKTQGCRSYDLWGIPDAPVETLEAEFSQRQEGLWGVYRFKRGFGGQVVYSLPAYDYVYNRPLYALFSKLWKRQ